MRESLEEQEETLKFAIRLLLDVIDGSHRDIRTLSARDLRPLLDLPYVAEAVWKVLQSVSLEIGKATPLSDVARRPTPLEIMEHVQQLQRKAVSPDGEAA